MTKEITVKQLAEELMSRIDASKGIDCCKAEIKKLAALAASKLPDEKVTVEWKD